MSKKKKSSQTLYQFILTSDCELAGFYETSLFATYGAIYIYMAYQMTDPAISSHVYLLLKKREDFSCVADAGSSIKYSACLGNTFFNEPFALSSCKKGYFPVIGYP